LLPQRKRRRDCGSTASFSCACATCSESVEPPHACNTVVAHPKRPNFNAFRRLISLILGLLDREESVHRH
jgi:hypothetical protein